MYWTRCYKFTLPQADTVNVLCVYYKYKVNILLYYNLYSKSIFFTNWNNVVRYVYNLHNVIIEFMIHNLYKKLQIPIVFIVDFKCNNGQCALAQGWILNICKMCSVHWRRDEYWIYVKLAVCTGAGMNIEYM